VSTTPAYLDQPGPIALAHRGFSLAGLENSMVAFQGAVDLGYRHVETDVHATADGVAIAFHDPALDRVTDTTGRIASLPWSQVRQARIGGTEPVPTLAEVLHAWPDLRVNLDIKAADAVEPAVAVIEREHAHDRVLVTSFNDARRRAVLARLSRPVATAGGTGVVVRFLAGVRARSPWLVARALRGIDCLQVPERQGRVGVVDETTLAAAHERGVAVHVWTVDDPGEMRRLLDLGVDGLVSNRADLLREVLTERGQWPPQG
jgi:glycerophosphoryl diester phosphodiesterase